MGEGCRLPEGEWRKAVINKSNLMNRLSVIVSATVLFGVGQIGTSSYLAAAPLPTSEQDNMVRDVVTLRGRGKITPVKGIQNFATANGRDAVVGFWIVQREFGRRQVELVQLSGLYIMQNTSAAGYIQQKLESLPHLVENSARRLNYLEMLPYIPSVWSASIAAKFLMSDEALRSEFEGDVLMSLKMQGPVIVNQERAAWVLSNMGFSNAPTSPDHINYTSSTIEQWREWWRKNEHQIDELMAEVVANRERALAGVPPTTAEPISVPDSPLPSPQPPAGAEGEAEPVVQSISD